jgi:hypothetical protein
MIRIDRPCSEKWENMIPSTDGNYCGICCKTVVDFSDKSNEEIIDYFYANTGKRICGRFKTEQVIRPKIKFTQTRFLAALLLVFGSMLFIGCNGNKTNHTIGDSIAPYHLTELEQAQRIADSTHLADSIIAANKEKMHEDSLHKK